MSSRTLKKLALYALQALLGVGVIVVALAVIGGISYLNEASRHGYAEMRSEILRILRNESIFVGLGTLLLFLIGTVRTYLARVRGAEQGRQTISLPR